MFAGASGKKYIDLRPVLVAVGHLGRRARAAIIGYCPAIYLLCTSLVLLAIYIDSARVMAKPVDSLPVAAINSFPGEGQEILWAKDCSLDYGGGCVTEAHLGPVGEPDVGEGLNNEIFPIFVLEDEAITEIWSQQQPVEGLLMAAGFTLGGGDRVEPEGSVSPRSEIRIFRETSNLDRGSTGTGREIVTAIPDEGAPCSHAGSREAANPGLSGALEGAHEMLNIVGRIAINSVIEVTATAYCPGTPGSGCPLNSQGHAFCTGCYNDGYTYTGKKAVQGEGTLESPRMIAVDPRIIPLGSLVYLEGIGFAIAEDIGGAIKGNRIDLFFDLHQDTSKFGLQKGIRLYLLAGNG